MSEPEPEAEGIDSVPYKTYRVDDGCTWGCLAPACVLALYTVALMLCEGAASDASVRIFSYAMLVSAPVTLFLRNLINNQHNRYIDSFVVGSRVFCPEVAPRLGEKLHLFWQAELGRRGQVETITYEVRVIQISTYPVVRGGGEWSSSGRGEAGETESLWSEVGPMEQFSQGQYRVKLTLPDTVQPVDPTEKYPPPSGKATFFKSTREWTVSFACELIVTVRLVKCSSVIEDRLSLKLPGRLNYQEVI